MPGTSRELARAERLAKAFAEELGVAPEGIWAAPGRVNLIGEHTDYNLGFALPFAIEQRALVALRRRSDEQIVLRSLQCDRQVSTLSRVAAGQISGWASYVAGAAWAVLGAGARGTGLDVWLDSDVPMGAGLSSSAAVSCASVLALAESWGLRLDRVALAKLAQKAETEIAGVPCGLLDQLTSFCAQPDRALCVDFENLSLEELPLPLEASGLEVVVIDTRAPHQLRDGHYAARRHTCERAAQALGKASLREASLGELLERWPRAQSEEFRRARHVITENARVRSAAALLRASVTEPGGARQLRKLGPLLSASHASLRDDYEVTVPHLDVAAASAERSGALGARMIGGGFGGSVLALCEGSGVQAVIETVEVAFLARNWAKPHTFGARPRAGATRLI